MPRHSWIAGKVDALVAELAAGGMHLDRDRAAAMINDRVTAIAGLLRVTEPTARRYLEDDAVRDIARQMLFEFVDEHPGADVFDLPRTVGVPLLLVGRVVAALAEAMQIRAANETSDRLEDVIATYGQTISGMGQMITEAAARPSDHVAKVAFPPALLRRAARYLRVASDQAAAQGGHLPDGVPEDHRAALVSALRRDADDLTALANKP